MSWLVLGHVVGLWHYVRLHCGMAWLLLGHVVGMWHYLRLHCGMSQVVLSHVVGLWCVLCSLVCWVLCWGAYTDYCSLTLAWCIYMVAMVKGVTGWR